jgi:transposase
MIDKIHPGYGAIDIGQEKIFVACAGMQEVRSFNTFSADLEVAAAYLCEKGVTKVAMEATGVYWIPLHDLLQSKGLSVTVFNGAHARNMPGRKSDVQDCQWHAMLHSHGLLVPCFIPPEQIRQLRCFQRLRDDHLGIGASHVQHMHKALDLMNIRLHVVISQIHGVSGLRVIRAILAGKRDPQALSELCDAQILKHKRAQVLASLQGHWQDHHIFALRQALEGYEFCQAQARACDQQIQALLIHINRDKPLLTPKAGQKIKQARHNVPVIDNLHGHLITMTGGRDVTALPGFTSTGFMKLLGETGPDLSAWPTHKHFTSWAGAAPGRNQSGRRNKRVPRKKTVIGQIFREAALSIAKSKHLALGAFYRRLRATRGAPIAIMAVARKLAELYYKLLTKGLDYVEEGIKRYEEKYQKQTLDYLKKKAAALGFTLTPNPQIQ